MKAITETTIGTPAVIDTAKSLEHLRAVSVIEGLLKIDGDKVSIPKGSDLTAPEIASFISDRAEKARTYGSQARWTWHAAGRMQNGEALQTAIRTELCKFMTKSAVYQLTSEAATLCPMIESEGFKAPLSLLKDAKAELVCDKDTGKLLPMAKQTKAGKLLIPLLKSGQLTQAKIREIRAAGKTNGNTAGTAPRKLDPIKGKENDAIEFGLMCGKLQEVATYLDKVKLEGEDRQKFVNIATDIARRLGLKVD